ncbi:uncharacterized protein K452DRAFT_292407 [Aplosporella prunicola CBS 121167]|uniref:Uncharacterized protein n=1 Tax=Aplosporella prunicola CBS 121167 TaxID=1176127 RepID=A0A6A6B067_9PEZI|nr:uncharacterized protein K452DRAFT_292407 [Aplosporella prunicola CBS 121167]KAF2136427.1 hypothetical protein K452DRAFT_292407 [Aplosporella prunicola CBS 121167]
MDPVRYSVGIPGLIQACAHAYRVVSTILSSDQDEFNLELRCRIEESRFRLCGRYWGVSDGSGDPHHSSEPQKKRTELQELLDLPGMESLVRDTLTRVHQLLQACEGYLKRFGSVNELGHGGSHESLSSTDSLAPRIPSRPPSRNAVKMRLYWTHEDKASFTGMLRSLAGLNDGLERLLPRRVKTSLESALIGEILAEKTLVSMKTQRNALVDALSFRAMKRDTHGESTGTVPDEDWKSGGTYRLSEAAFTKLSKTKVGRTMEQYIPPADSPIDEARGSSEQRGSNDVQQEKQLEQRVFIEWRKAKKANDEEYSPTVRENRKEAGRVFPHAGGEPAPCTLPCLGYVAIDTHAEHDIFGLVYRMPEACIRKPISLAELLQRDFECSATAPNLETRLGLARKLAMALYELKCVGKSHGQISSHNIVYCPPTSSGSSPGTHVHLQQPYITGWQPWQQGNTGSESPTVGFQEIGVSEQERYFVHPKRPRTRFKHLYDIYSLGIVLAEIAFWEPISALRDPSEDALKLVHDSLMSWRHRIYATAERELGADVGTAYRDAVLWCLRGLEVTQINDLISNRVSKEDFDREIGIEKAFFWNVVQRLDSASRIV